MDKEIYCALILNYNDARRTVKAAKKLLENEFFEEIVIIDNCSTDDSIIFLNSELKDSRISIIKSDKNGGYGYGNNYGLRYIMKKYGSQLKPLVLIANPDTAIDRSAICSMIRCFDINEDCLACAPRQLTVDGAYFKNTAWPISSPIRYAASNTIIGKFFLRSDQYCFDLDVDSDYFPVDCLSGALLMVDVKKMLSIGGYHEEMFLFCEETSIGIRAKGKYKSFLCLKETYIHEHSASIKMEYSSFVQQFQLLRASRLYVLKQDYKIKGFNQIVCSLLDLLSIAEVPFRGVLMRLLD